MEINNELNQRTLRCKASTDANKLAGSIHSIYMDNEKVEGNGLPDIIIRVIGAGALNQATKAAIISNKFLAKKGLVIALKPSFKDAVESMTAIELRILFLKN